VILCSSAAETDLFLRRFDSVLQVLEFFEVLVLCNLILAFLAVYFVSCGSYERLLRDLESKERS